MVTFLNSYLKDQKQNIRISNIFSAFQNSYHVHHKVLAILGLILLNIFLNDLFLRIKKSDLYNFTNDNTISPTLVTRDVKPFYKLDIKNSILPSYESP